MGLSHSIVHELCHFQNVLLSSFTVFLRWTAFTFVCLHSYASTEDRLLIALSRFALLGMYSAEVRWPILRILLNLAHALNTQECDLCQKEKPSPFYNWAVSQATQYKSYLAQRFERENLFVGYSNKKSKLWASLTNYTQRPVKVEINQCNSVAIASKDPSFSAQ